MTIALLMCVFKAHHFLLSSFSQEPQHPFDSASSAPRSNATYVFMELFDEEDSGDESSDDGVIDMTEEISGGPISILAGTSDSIQRYDIINGADVTISAGDTKADETSTSDLRTARCRAATSMWQAVPYLMMEHLATSMFIRELPAMATARPPEAF